MASGSAAAASKHASVYFTKCASWCCAANVASSVTISATRVRRACATRVAAAASGPSGSARRRSDRVPGGVRLPLGVERALTERGAEADDVRARDRDRTVRIETVARDAHHRLRHREAVAPAVGRVVVRFLQHRPRRDARRSRSGPHPLRSVPATTPASRRAAVPDSSAWCMIGKMKSLPGRPSIGTSSSASASAPLPTGRRIPVLAILEPAQPPVGVAAQLARRAAQRATGELDRPAATRGRRYRKMLACAAAASDADDRPGERAPELHRRRPIAERGGVAVDVVEIARVERGDERGCELARPSRRPPVGVRRPDRPRPRTRPRGARPGRAAASRPIGPHVAEQARGAPAARAARAARRSRRALPSAPRALGRDRDGRLGGRRRHARHGRT